MAAVIDLSVEYCGGPGVMCGAEFPCCDFDSEAYLQAATWEGAFDPCEPRFWKAPTKPSPSSDLYSCEYSDLDFDESGWVKDSDPLSGSTPDPWSEEYWSSRFLLPPPSGRWESGLCNSTPTADLDSECLPPGIWPGRILPTKLQVEEVKSSIGVRQPYIHRSMSEWEEEADLLQMAVALLVLNRDLVEWVLCICGAGERLRNCWLAMLDAPDEIRDTDSVKVTVVLRNEILPNVVGHPALAWAPPWASAIHISRQTDWWRAVMDAFAGPSSYLLEGVTPPVNRADRTCAVIDVAAVILHESGHLCFADLPTDICRSCDAIVLLVENTFRWAMFQRYDVARSGVCGKYVEQAFSASCTTFDSFFP